MDSVKQNRIVKSHKSCKSIGHDSTDSDNEPDVLGTKHDYWESYQSRKGQSCLGTDEFDGVAVVNISLANAEFFRFGLVVCQQVDREGAPSAGTGVETASIHVEVASAHCLRAQTVEQGDLCARANAH